MTTRRLPDTTRVVWRQAWRTMAARYPPITLFERVTRDHSEWEAVVAAAMLTNPRIRDEVGEISLVPTNERVSGPGASWVMASFTHPWASRFTDGRVFGVYYAAASLETAVREYAYHSGRFFESSKRPRGDTMELRSVVGTIDTAMVEIRGGFPELHDPRSYTESQRFGVDVREAGQNGIVYDSVRHPGGECVAAMRPRAVGIPHQAAHVILHFDGSRMDRWFHTGTHAWKEFFAH